MNRSQFSTKLKRKFNIKSESSESKDNITEDSSDNMYSDAEASKLTKTYHIEGEYEDSNDSLALGGSKDASFTDKDYLNAARQKDKNSNKPMNENIYLQQCLDYIHRVLSRKDKEDVFQYPVTDLIAPGYSSIIKRPMDFSTMKKKIDSFQYCNILEYRDDFVLMCENAMTYNKSDTIYYHAARKLLDSGLKLLNKDKILSLRRTLPVMKNLTTVELGFVPEGEAEASFEHQIIIQRKKQAQKHFSTIQTITQQSLISKSTILQKLEAIKHEVPEETPESILAMTQKAAKTAADKLASKYPNSKLGYLRRNSNGASTFNFINKNDNNGEKDLTVGNLSEALDSGSYSLSSFAEEKKNKASPMYYLEYGPFSSHAPIYDSSYSNLSKEESDLLMSTYGDETGYQYALSLVEFAKGTGPTFVKYVDDLLNSITNNEHQNYLEKKANNGISSTTDCEGSTTTITTTTSNNDNERKQSSDNNPVEITVDKPDRKSVV